MEKVIVRKRVCHIQRGSNGFGFILCCETDTTDTYVLHVLKSSPASRASLMPGDKIIEVNGLNVERESHKEVVERLQGLQSVKLMVAHSNAAQDYFRKPGNGMTVRPLENCDESLRPKLVTVNKNNEGFDFVLQTVGKSKRMETGRYRQQLRGTAGHFVGTVDKGGVAYQAGLRPGHRIIEVNGVNVEKECHAFIIAKIRGAKSLDLLVVDEDTDDFFQRHGIAPNAKHLNGQLEFGTALPTTPTKSTSGSSPQHQQRPYISPPLLQYNPPVPSSASSTMQRRPSRSMSFMKKMTMSTPDLSFGSSKSTKKPDTVSTDLSFFDRLNRKQRTAKAKKEIKRHLSKLERSKPPPRADYSSRGVTSPSRRLYDDTIISDTEEEKKQEEEDATLRRIGDMPKTSGPGSTSSTSDYGSNGGASPTRSPKWPQASSKGPKVVGKAPVPLSPRPQSVLHNNTLEECEMHKPPPPKAPTDLSSVEFKVDLKTLKQRVQMRSQKSKSGMQRAKSQLLDYGLAQQYVDAW